MINRILATPKVRKFARELGADISNLKGSERNGRITEEDVKNFIKGSKKNTLFKETQKPALGFIAHEVSGIVPEAINGTKDAVDADGNAVMQGIDQSKLVPLLVKTIQELETRIVALENA